MSKIIPLTEPQKKAANPERFALFAYGFRPFFLLTGLYGVIALLPWFAFLFEPESMLNQILAASSDPEIWHGHEMIFGVVSAAIVGFLLTVIPNWTGCKPVSGIALTALVVLWLVGRIGFWTMETLPHLYLVDLLLFPALLAIKTPVLILAGQPRNMVFLFILILLTACNGVVHYGLWQENHTLAENGLKAAVYLIVFMIAIIGGRIIPAFTRTALNRDGIPADIRSFQWLEKTAIAGLVILFLAAMMELNETIVTVLALIMAAVHLVRLAFWQGWKTLHEPILWVLHAGYLWMPLGLALMGLAPLLDLNSSLSVHAFTVGLMGTLILAVMSRASLGHTGRMLRAHPATVAGYVCVLLAAVGRVVLPLSGIDYFFSLQIAGLLWMLAFSLFSVIYVPILLRPRADGRPG